MPRRRRSSSSSSEVSTRPSKVSRTPVTTSETDTTGTKASELEAQALSGPREAAEAVGPLVDLVVGALDVDDPSSCLPALLSAHRVFTHFQKIGTLGASRAKQRASTSLKSTAVDAYRNLIANQHRLFLEAALEWLHLEDDVCRVAALRCLFAQSAAPGRKNIDRALLSRLITSVMTGGVAGIEVLAVLLTEKVLKYGDVSLITIHALRRSLEMNKDKTAESNKNEDDGTEGSATSLQDRNGSERDALSAAERRMVAQNVHAVLSRIPMPPSQSLLSSSLLNASRDGDTERDSDLSSAWRDAASHTKAYGDCWLLLLSMKSLSRSMYVKMLSQVPTLALPHISDPLALSDFLIDSYDLGGEASLLALDGLWNLIRNHDLDYPDFFPRLYALLTPSVFHSENRSRFFSKVALFLRSSRLPIYTVAAFIKRLSRLCLSAPPDGVLYALPLVFRLMCTHKGCVVLVHRDPESGESGVIENVVSSDDEDADVTQDGDRVEVTNESMDDAAAWRGSDTFRPDEPNPQKSRALGSSLWEVAALQSHYHPGVATVAKMFNQRLTGALPVDDFTEQDYASLFKEAMLRRVKKVPLEFRKPTFVFR